MEDRLQKFAYLIDVGSFTKAARDLHISQPALSMAMHKLEKELKTQLYVRGSQPLAATPAGSLAYKSAKELSASLRGMHAQLSEMLEEEVTMSIGVIDSVADIMLANNRIITTLESQAKVSLVINNSRYLLTALERGDIDVAIIAEQSKPLGGTLHAERLGAEPLIVTVHRDSAARIRQEYLAKEVTSFISYDQPSRTHAMIEHFFAEQGIAVSPQFYSSSPDVIYRLVMAKKGAAALPYRKVSRQLHIGKLVALGPQPIIPRQIVVARRNYYMPEVIRKTIERLEIDLSLLMQQAQAH